MRQIEKRQDIFKLLQKEINIMMQKLRNTQTNDLKDIRCLIVT